ncbi:transcriptional repressor CTCF-like [Leguminivora glycinivorella]|uniref:transcriptional repressor CTCF-like n=1 Tax=Leguminivora glycinivorella TaxID=1035111 RepID=UPI00200D874B|nr:transcriptional repressor CTCF-like [Leguminivora glycinivorella]
MGVSTSESDCDDENNVILRFDQIKLLQNLTMLSEAKTATESVALLLESISMEHVNKKNTKTKKRPSNETIKHEEKIKIRLNETTEDEGKSKTRPKETIKNEDKNKNRPNQSIKNDGNTKSHQNEAIKTEDKTKKRPCNEIVTNEDRPKRTRKSHENQNENKWKCNICYETFHNKSNLYRHLKNVKLHPKRYCAEKIGSITRFRCGFCGQTYSNRGNVNRHLNSHHSRNITFESESDSDDDQVSSDTSVKDSDDKEEETEEKLLNVDIKMCVFVCEQCEVATPEIDRAVEHAQFHELPGYRPIPQTCQICKYTFEAQDVTEHSKIHDRANAFIRYEPFKLLNNEWSDIFQGLEDTLVNTIKSSTIYEHTRKVKMNTDDTDDSSSKPHLYQCGTCEMFVRPVEVKDHCDKEKDCLENQSGFHICDDCERFFVSDEALSEHVLEEKENVTFKTVTFNCEQDLPINRALRKLQNNLQQENVSNTGEEAARKTRQSTQNEKEIVILDNRPITQFCQECNKFLSVSDITAHEATHRHKNNKNEAEENMSTEQDFSDNINEKGNIPGNNSNKVESIGHIMDHINQITSILKDKEDIIDNNTMRIENVRSILNTDSADQCKIGLDDGFRTIGNALRHDLGENFKKCFNNDADIASKDSTANNMKIPDNNKGLGGSSSGQNNIEDDIADDKSQLQHIIEAMHIKLSNTNEVIEISDEEHEVNSNLIEVKVKEEMVEIEDDKSQIQHIIAAVEKELNNVRGSVDLTDDPEKTAVTNVNESKDENDREISQRNLERIIEVKLKNKELMSNPE